MSKLTSDQEVALAASLISQKRLAALVAMTGSERDALAIHSQMMSVAAALGPVLGLIEVVLRNAVCARLDEMFGSTDWLNNPPAPFAWRSDEVGSLRRATGQAQRAEYSKLTNVQKKALETLAYPAGVSAGATHEHRVKRRQRAITVDMGQHIAQLTFHFWKRLFSAEYEATLWDRSLKRLFPDKGLSRPEVATQLEAIYQARNRIAHHEPVYGPRLRRALAAIDFVSERFLERRPNPESILCKMIGDRRQHLQREADALEALLARFPSPAPH